MSKPKVRINTAALEQIGEQVVKETSVGLQAVLDSVFNEYAGQPVEVIKPVLAARWASAMQGTRLTDPELTNITQAISKVNTSSFGADASSTVAGTV